MIYRSLSIVTALLCFFTSAYCQLHFVPDSTYGTNGIARPNTTTTPVWLHHMLGSAIQPDGKIVIAGTGNFQNNLEVVRLDTNGVLDTSFNHTGFIEYVANGSSPWKFIGVRIAPSGNIMVGYYSLNPGNARYTLLSLLPNGMVNTAFGVAGKGEIGPALAGKELLLSSLELQADGKAILTGGGPDALATHKYLIARIKTNGRPDTSFAINGIANCPYLLTEARHMQLFATRLQADGKLLCAGTIPPGAAGNPDTLVLIRYKTNGTLDSAYGTNGIVKMQDVFQAGAIRINAANEAYVIGKRGQIASPDTMYIRKFSPTGTLVTSFGTAGTATVATTLNTWNDHEQLNYLGRFELLSDGKMIVGGPSDSSSASAFSVCRLNADGSMDTSFATNGVITVHRGIRDYCSDVQVQANGRIVLTGFYRTGEGTFDTARVLAMRFRYPDTASATDTATNVNTVSHRYTGSGYIYPDPVEGGQFTLAYHNAGPAGFADHVLTSIAGRQVAAGQAYLQQGDGRLPFSIGKDVPPGIYLLHVSGQAFSGVYKVVVGK